MSDDNMAMLTPGSAAARLNVSGAALRRMAVAYVEVYASCPKRQAVVACGLWRLWSD
jgi:Ni,Fe-hydrogenase III small subunit